MFQILNFLYHFRLIERYNPKVPYERDLIPVFFGSIAEPLLAAIYYYQNYQRISEKTTYIIDLGSINLIVFCLLIIMDTYYYWVHRLLHHNKTLWNYIKFECLLILVRTLR
jgi:uncharacterized membrane protein YesL